MDDVRLSVLVPKDLHRRAKSVAALRGDSLSKIVRSALEDYVEEAEDSALLNRIEAEVAEGKQRVYSHEEVWAELDALPD
jgi:predicted DNA-binding protein